MLQPIQSANNRVKRSKSENKVIIEIKKKQIIQKITHNNASFKKLKPNINQFYRSASFAVVST